MHPKKILLEYKPHSKKTIRNNLRAIPCVLARNKDLSQLNEIKEILGNDDASETLNILEMETNKNNSRESQYLNAQTLLNEHKYINAKEILLKLTNKMDRWGVVACYKMLKCATELNLSINQLAIIAKAITICDYNNDFDNENEFRRTLRECYNLLGSAYIDIDATSAFKYFTEAAQMGHSAALYNIGNCYRNGLGCRKNYIQALSYFRKAKAAGYQSDELEQAIEEVSNIMKGYGNSYKRRKRNNIANSPLFTFIANNKVLTFLLTIDIVLIMFMAIGWNSYTLGVFYIVFLLGFSVYWILQYYKNNQTTFWGVPDNNGLMRTFFWRKEPYSRIFKISLIILESVCAALITIIFSALLLILLEVILSTIYEFDLEVSFSVISTFILAFIIRNENKSLAWSCAILATYFLFTRLYPEYDLYASIAVVLALLIMLKRYKLKTALALLPIITYIASIRFFYIYELLDYFYWSFDYELDVITDSFEEFFDTFVYEFLPYLLVALLYAMIPILLFLVVAIGWMIFAYCLRFYDWVTTKIYSVKHPCPYCQENSEPATYYSCNQSNNRLYELKATLRPGVYGLFHITHPDTGVKMPTLLINGRTKQFRKCHHCGEMILSEDGTNKHIAMVGCPGSGKSALCISMIADMLRNNPKLILGEDIDADIKEGILNVGKIGHMTAETLPQKTREGRMPSIRVNIPRIGPDYALYLDDIAGESFDTSNINTSTLNFLYNTTSLIFIIDPHTAQINNPGSRMKLWMDEHKEFLLSQYNLEDIFSNVRTRINEIDRLKKITINFVLVKSDSGYLDLVNTACEETLKDFIANEMGLYNIANNNEFKESHFYAVTTMHNDGSISRLNDNILAQQNIS